MGAAQSCLAAPPALLIPPRVSLCCPWPPALFSYHLPANPASLLAASLAVGGTWSLRPPQPHGNMSKGGNGAGALAPRPTRSHRHTPACALGLLSQPPSPCLSCHGLGLWDSTGILYLLAFLGIFLGPVFFPGLFLSETPPSLPASLGSFISLCSVWVSVFVSISQRHPRPRQPPSACVSVCGLLGFPACLHDGCASLACHICDGV